MGRRSSVTSVLLGNHGHAVNAGIEQVQKLPILLKMSLERLV